MLRCLLDLPLGDTAQHTPAAMLNLLGEAGHSGPAHYAGVEECLRSGGVYLHLYGKTHTSPFRKMGHVTTAGATIDEAIRKANFVKRHLKVVAASAE